MSISFLSFGQRHKLWSPASVVVGDCFLAAANTCHYYRGSTLDDFELIALDFLESSENCTIHADSPFHNSSRVVFSRFWTF